MREVIAMLVDHKNIRDELTGLRGAMSLLRCVKTSRKIIAVPMIASFQ